MAIKGSYCDCVLHVAINNCKNKIKVKLSILKRDKVQGPDSQYQLVFTLSTTGYNGLDNWLRD